MHQLHTPITLSHKNFLRSIYQSSRLIRTKGRWSRIFVEFSPKRRLIDTKYQEIIYVKRQGAESVEWKLVQLTNLLQHYTEEVVFSNAISRRQSFLILR